MQNHLIPAPAALIHAHPLLIEVFEPDGSLCGDELFAAGRIAVTRAVEVAGGARLSFADGDIGIDVQGGDEIECNYDLALGVLVAELARLGYPALVVGIDSCPGCEVIETGACPSCGSTSGTGVVLVVPDRGGGEPDA
jgi:hypothetical protein